MARAILQSLAFFLTPFVVFSIYLALSRRFPFAVEHWTGRRTAMLALAGLFLVIISLVVVAMKAPRFEGEYSPARIEDGRIVPGTAR